MLLEHPRAAEIYPRYLAAGYHVTCAMLELMELALARARELDDDVSKGLARYLDRHLSRRCTTRSRAARCSTTSRAR